MGLKSTLNKIGLSNRVSAQESYPEVGTDHDEGFLMERPPTGPLVTCVLERVSQMTITRLLRFVSAALVLAAVQGPLLAAKKKAQANPSQSRDQIIQVRVPYCDAYLPYTHHGNEEISPILESDPSDEALNAFLNRNLTTSDAIPKSGLFADPGFPVLANPGSHFYTDGSDLTRVITRLTYGNTTPICSGAQTSKATNPAVRQSQYFLVHIVRWEIKQDGGYGYTSDNSQWYVFNKSDKKEAHRQFPFTFHPFVNSDLRMFGSSQVFFLAIHLAPQGNYAQFKEALSVAYKMSVQKLEPINLQDLQALGNVVSPVPGLLQTVSNLRALESVEGIGSTPTTGPLNPHLAEYKALLASKPSYAGLYAAAKLTGLTSLPDQITASLNVKFNSKPGQQDVPLYCLPGFWDTSTSCSTQVAPAASGGNEAEAEEGPSAGAVPPPATTPVPNPSKSVGCLQSGGDCTDKQTVRDEGLYWWDAGVGVPFNSYKDLQVSNGNVTTTNISKQTAYGFMILAPWREDFVTPPSLGIPHIMIGVPLTGKVLDHPFFGLGESVNLSKIGVPQTISQIVSMFRFYAGLSENKTFGAAITSGVEPPHRWIGKLQYGIEFSIRDVASKLSGSGSN